MRRVKYLLAFAVLAATPANAAPTEDAAAFLTTLLDPSNPGGMNAFLAACQDGAFIVDEFAPYVWSGSGSPQRWAADYAKHMKATGVSDPRVDYGKPIQANATGASHYIVLPTTYRFVQNGRKMVALGNMAFVVNRVGADWKIASWSYAGATAAPE